MTAVRHVFVPRALVVAVFAVALAACGLKGPLEPPPEGATLAATDARIETVPSEKSSVVRTGYPTVIPQIPPPEWTKPKNPQPTPPRVKQRVPRDEPFLLDWLL